MMIITLALSNYCLYNVAAMKSLNNKRILIGITGGIAAYKSAELVRRLIGEGADVRVVMTAAAKEFITPLTLQALSGHEVHDDLLATDAEAGMGHIQLARWADAVLIAPASANFIARLVQGRGDDLLSTICLATSAPIAVAPAMNQQMWQNQATQDNIKILQQRGIKLFGPAEGEQACGEMGFGRMQEPEQLAQELSTLFRTGALSGVKLVITAGPTQEAIDPVRFLSNRSTGKMGYAIAQAAQEAGATVCLVSGPVHLPCPERVERINVTTAVEMHEVVLQRIKNADMFIATAAVSDYRPKEVSETKIKKSAEQLDISLVRNPDILLEVAALANAPFTVGFAAETNDVIENAKQKLHSKKLNMIVANQVSETKGFASDDNEVTVLSSSDAINIGPTSKYQIALALIKIISKNFSESSIKREAS